MKLIRILVISMILLVFSACSEKKTKSEKSEKSPKSETSQHKAEIFTETNGTVTAGILFDQNNTMYVAKDQELLKITPDGLVTSLCSFQDLPNRKDYYFKSPLIWDMTFDNEGNILAAAQDRILKITPEGQVTTLIREDFKGFLGASGIECDEEGNIYITNGSKIEKYSSELKKTTLVDGVKNGYTSSFSLEFDPDYKNLYVSDFYTKSLLRYEIDETGNVSEEPVVLVKEPIKNSGDFGAPLNIVFASSGSIYVSIDGMAQIMRMDKSGEVEYLALGDTSISNHIIAFGGKGFNEECLYITTFNGEYIYKYNVGETR